MDLPHDPDFVAKAGPVLDLYAGRLEGRLLPPGDFVISADETPLTVSVFGLGGDVRLVRLVLGSAAG